MKKKNILAITLARGGSKSIKNKNIINILGKPLIYYTIREAKRSKLISDYVVSTDNKIIAETAKKYGAKTPFIRPKNISKDNSTSVDALVHAVKFMEKKNKIKYDFVIELMCTNPLKTYTDIDKVIKILIKKNPDTCIAVNRVYDNHPARVKKIINGRIVDFVVKEKPESRRQDLKPKAFVRSGAIYGIKRDYLINKKRRYGSKKSLAYVLAESKACNIDEPKDILIAQYLLKNAI